MSQIMNKIREIEDGLSERHISINDFCKDAGINRSTWQRWKSGYSMPTMRTWEAVNQKYDRIANAK